GSHWAARPGWDDSVGLGDTGSTPRGCAHTPSRGRPGALSTRTRILSSPRDRLYRGSMQTAPLLKDLVLVGGGHAHVHVLKSFAMKPMPGVRLTLIGRDVETPYSGMIPGFVAGTYSFEECHIDLARLAAWTGARLIHAEATGLDRDDRLVMLKDRPPIGYDVL